MNITEIISLTAVVVAILALGWQIRTSNKQSKMQTFLTYTERYQEIVLNLPIGMESEDFSIENFDEKTQEKILKWLRAYFDLCSEEYYLKNNRLIDKEAWRLWESGMKDSLKKPAFIQSWRIIQTNKYFHKDFAGYIEGIIES
jgi:hypothetical protein